METQEELEAWLRLQPRETCIVLAYRAALRVLPLARLSETSSEEDGLRLLSSMRAIMVSGVAAAIGFPEEVASEASREAWQDAKATSPADNASNAIKSVTRSSSQSAWVAAANAAAAAGKRSPRRPSLVFTRINSADNEVRSSALRAAIEDHRFETNSLLVMAVQQPVELSAAYSELKVSRTDLLATGGPWTFWADWYDRAMAGDPLPWELQREVALIPGDIWKLGPEAVAQAVEAVEARFAFRQAVREIEKDQGLHAGGNVGIGHNNPPVEIDEPEVMRDLTVLWDAIASLKKEDEKTEPDSQIFAYLITKGKAALSKVLSWLADRFTLAIDTCIKWGIPTAGGYFYLNPEKAKAVLDLAETYLPYLAK